MPTVASTLYENIHSLHMEQSPVDQCPLLYNFLLIPCYLTLLGPATISLSHLMLSLTGLRSPPRSQLKGSCWSQTGACWLGILKTSSEENSPQAPWEGTLPSAPDHWQRCKMRRHWAVGTHPTAKESSVRHPVLNRRWRPLNQTDEEENSWRQGGLLLSQTPDQDHMLTRLKPFFFFFFLLWFSPGKMMFSPLSPSHCWGK